MDNSWVVSLENRIFTIIKAKTMPNLKKTYSKIKYTTEDENVEPITVFPTVYIAELNPSTSYTDLEKNRIDEILTTFTVRVTVNTNKTDSMAIATAIMEAFISINFDVVTIPLVTRQGDLFVANARFRRKICRDDTI